MTELSQALAEWLNDVEVDWTEAETGEIRFRLDWGSSEYDCTASAKDRILTLRLAWSGSFKPALNEVGAFLPALCRRARCGQVWINQCTGEAVFEVGVEFPDDGRPLLPRVVSVLRYSVDVFNVMTCAMNAVISATMDQDEAIQAFKITLGILSSADDSDKEMPDSASASRGRAPIFWRDEDDGFYSLIGGSPL